MEKNDFNRVSRPSVFLALAIAVPFAFSGCGGGGGPSSGPSTYTVGGTVSGLDGTLLIQNNSANDTTLTVDGAFTFSMALTDGSAYSVTVKTHPVGQTCAVANGSGTIAGANVTNVTITCVGNPGSLDTAFGTDGTLISASTSSYDEVIAVAMQADDKIVVAGRANISGLGAVFALARYHTDGTLDTTFGTGGKVTTDVRPGSDFARGVAIQADGKIVAAGESFNRELRLRPCALQHRRDARHDFRRKRQGDHRRQLLAICIW